jgi:hypothetical protein
MNILSWFFGILKPAISFAEGFKAIPSNITIAYNENVTIQVGNIDLETGNFTPAIPRFFLAARFISFSVEFPEGYEGGWFVNFDPPVIIEKAGVPSITNATISLHSPYSLDTAVQSTTIRIKIEDTWVVKNLWWPEDKAYWPLGDKWVPFATSPPFWFLAALLGGFGKNSGKVLTDYYYIDVLVTVKPYHSINIKSLAPARLTPNNVISIPVLVQSQGNYNDTISFRAKSENGSLLKVTQNSTIGLKPGEQGQVFIGVASPNNFLDTGTLHKITLEAYSADQPNVTIATQDIALETQGVYVSEENATFSILFGLLFLVVVFLFFYWRRKVAEKIRKKPEKPWKIPEEQQHLAILKRSDKNAYEQERILMQDEYKSALLWYKEDKKPTQKNTIKEPSKKPFSSFFNKLQMSLKSKVKPKTQPKKTQPILRKKPEKKPKAQTVKPTVLTTDQTKEKILAKIRKEQEKQLRKLP